MGFYSAFKGLINWSIIRTSTHEKEQGNVIIW